MLFNFQVKNNTLENWHSGEEYNLLSSMLQKGEVGVGYSFDENNNYAEIECRIGPSDELTFFSQCPMLFQYPMPIQIVDDFANDISTGIVYNEEIPTEGEKIIFLRTVKKMKIARITTFVSDGSCDVQLYSGENFVTPVVACTEGEISTQDMSLVRPLEESYFVEEHSFLGIKITNVSNAKNLIVQIDWKEM
jgi:hypothetical protein